MQASGKAHGTIILCDKFGFDTKQKIGQCPNNPLVTMDPVTNMIQLGG